MVDYVSGWPTSCATIRTSIRSWRSADTDQYAALLDAVEAAQNARVVADAGDRRAAAQAIRISRASSVFLVAPPSLRFGGHQTKSAYDFTLARPRHGRAIHASADAGSVRSPSCPGLVDVTTDLQIKNPQVNVKIDRDRAAALGLDANQIETALYSALWPALVVHHLRAHQSIRSADGDPAEIPGVLRLSFEDLLQDSSGQLVPLSNFASLNGKPRARRASITRASSLRSRFRSM